MSPGDRAPDGPCPQRSTSVPGTGLQGSLEGDQGSARKSAAVSAAPVALEHSSDSRCNSDDTSCAVATLTGGYAAAQVREVV